ncbi:MAG: hypothetical protein CSA35_00170 [Dethiosulfovibrio peptidovorans]|nr:MAG: hypothetical protein CSA35_00170 [Dethiosulfovibrio peptidovorans]
MDLSALAGATDVWECWRFLPWADGDLAGVYRRATFIKAGLMGEVARYYADDYILWTYGADSLARVRREWGSIPDVMIQRLIFVSPEDKFDKKVKAFALGLRGYLETYRYAPMGQGYAKIRDLTPLIDKAWELVQSMDRGGVEQGNHPCVV